MILASAPRQGPADTAPATAQPPVPAGLSGAWAALVLVLAGLVLGAAYLVPAGWPLAWLGLMLTAWGLQLSRQRSWTLAGLMLGSLFSHWLGHPWYFDATFYWGGGVWSAWQTAGMWVFATTMMALAERLPLMLVVASPLRSLPLWLWFPLAWWGGEKLNFYFTGMMQNSFLYSQWQAEPVLRLLGHAGWNLTLLLILGICALAADSLYRRRWRRLACAALGPALGLLLPPLSADSSALAGVGVVQMADYAEPPRWIPLDTRLLIWPEVIRMGRPRVGEGPVTGLKLQPPLPSAHTYHLFGQETRTQTGLQNSLLATAPDGTLLQARAKRLLFPAAERPFLGWGMSGRRLYQPGKRSALMQVGGLPIAALLCLEAFDHDLGQQARQAGARLLTVSAIDHDMRDSPLAVSQLVGVTVMLAVETHLPVARSSLYGASALIAPNGKILRISPAGASGILTLARDWPAYLYRP